jgi:hypothetical protein
MGMTLTASSGESREDCQVHGASLDVSCHWGRGISQVLVGQLVVIRTDQCIRNKPFQGNQQATQKLDSHTPHAVLIEHATTCWLPFLFTQHG